MPNSDINQNSMTLSASFIIVISLLYLLVQYLRYYFQWTYKEPIFQKYWLYNLRVYGPLSLLLCLYAFYSAGLTRFESVDRMVCHITDKDVDNISIAMFIFLLSKIVEMQDIITWELLGNQCSLNFRVHHNTTLPVTFIALKANSSANLLCLTSNTFMHFLLVPLLTRDITNSIWFWMVRIWGFVQLFIGLFCGFYAIYFRFIQKKPCYGEFYAEIIGIASYILYLALYVYDIVIARSDNKKENKTE